MSAEALSDIESDLLILFRQLNPGDQDCVQRVAQVLFQGAQAGSGNVS
ncbi:MULTISPECIES: hypothetical protein [Pseudomonas]|nr:MULTISPECIES: hypothetical protein [Pseudomonas]